MSDADDPLRDERERLDAATTDPPSDVGSAADDELLARLEEELSGTWGVPEPPEPRLDRVEDEPARASDTAASGAASTGEPTAATRVSPVGRDIATVLCLLFLPALLWVAFGMRGALVGVGVAWSLLWTSRTWTARERLLGTLVWPGGLATTWALGRVATQMCGGDLVVVDGTGAFVSSTPPVCEGFALPPAIGVPLWLLNVGAPVVVATLLLARGDRRRRGD